MRTSKTQGGAARGRFLESIRLESSVAKRHAPSTYLTEAELQAVTATLLPILEKLRTRNAKEVARIGARAAAVGEAAATIQDGTVTLILCPKRKR